MRYLKYILAVLVVALSVPSIHAKKKVVDIYELTFDENLETPIPANDNIAERIAQFQGVVAEKLYEKNPNTWTMRDGEVIMMTFPASQLFAPNDTVLTEVGKVALKPLLPFLKTPGLYKMLLLMHSDDTGSDEYTMELTRCRVNAVYDWIDANGSVDFVVPYALGATTPSVDDKGIEIPNDSMENRKKNRRLEIYLVPEESMMELAKKGKIDLKILNIKK